MLAAPLASAQSSLAPETEKCLALRARYDIETPTSGDRIFAYTEAAHHTTVEYCTVAWRDAAGLWTVSGAGEESAGLLNIPAAPIKEERRVLSIADGDRIDQLLASNSLYDETSPKQESAPNVGASFHTIEIVSSHGHQLIHWIGRLKGQTGEGADLVMGAG